MNDEELAAECYLAHQTSGWDCLLARPDREDSHAWAEMLSEAICKAICRAVDEAWEKKGE